MNWNKFKNLVHVVCEKAEDPACLGAIKLNKVLWYSDVIQYLITGYSITGETYVKRQHGPVPRDIMRALRELENEGKIARGKADHFGFMKCEYIAIHEADKTPFTGPEMALIQEAFDHVCHRHTARSVSEETHNLIWNLAEMGEEIPYEAAFAATVGEVDEADIQWAREIRGEAATV